MNVEYIYHILDSSGPALDKEQALQNYLGQRLHNLPQSDAKRTKIAYEIAGLLSTSYARSLSEGSPYEEILTLAAELEVTVQVCGLDRVGA